MTPEALPIKLHSFILEDEHNLALSAIKDLALETAHRRADMMDWKDISVHQLNIKEKQGNATWYVFEIYGQGEALEDDDQTLLSLLDKLKHLTP